ncbi:beta strand repeat-containing protein [Paraburkholderia phenoliruptrix]|uniref:Beta strand repeat-containing protein n=1 Tax=Paraburkholderia phenoliruptrix TaxID=252970 RepID=A0ABV3WH79_9BURK
MPVASGGTNSASASGTALDNITGFSSTGFLTRTGAGTYAFQSLTNGITYGNLAQAPANTVLGNFSGSTGNVTAATVTGCNGAAQALQFTNASGFGCNSAISAATLNATAWASPGAIGGTTPNSGTFTGITVNPSSGDAIDILNGAAGTNRSLLYETSGSKRWLVNADSASESGSNAGTNYSISRYTDAGALIDTPFWVQRSSGIVNMIDGAAIGGALVLSGNGVNTIESTIPTLTALPADIGGGQHASSYTQIQADNVAAGATFILGNEHKYVFGGSSATGGRIAEYNFLYQSAATSSSNTQRNYVGTQSEVTSVSGDGGTNLTSGAQGAYFGFATDSRLQTGATNVWELTGGEIDTDTQTGSSTKYLIGWSIVGNNTVQGSALDAALDIGGNNQQGDGNHHAGWNFGIVFDDIHGYSPVNSNSTLLGGSFPTLGTQTINYGINLGSFSCTTACYASNGFSVLQNGTINTAGINGTTNGAAATSGTVGQALSNSSSGVSLTSGVAANGTSINLGPGQYNVQCTAQFSPAGSTTINSVIVGINTTSATLPGYAQQTALQASFTTGNYQVITSPTVYENLTAGSTTVYCPVLSGFGSSTMSVNATINVLRVH